MFCGKVTEAWEGMECWEKDGIARSRSTCVHLVFLSKIVSAGGLLETMPWQCWCLSLIAEWLCALLKAQVRCHLSVKTFEVIPPTTALLQPQLPAQTELWLMQDVRDVSLSFRSRMTGRQQQSSHLHMAWPYGSCPHTLALPLFLSEADPSWALDFKSHLLKDIVPTKIYLPHFSLSILFYIQKIQ